MLTFELKPAKGSDGPDELEVNLDGEGLDSLIAQLSFLKKRSGHVHLMSKSWGGNHLDDRPINPDASIIHHVVITLR
jgi:hypothetical protein